MKILSIFGTRPEAIKMAPVVKAFANAFGDSAKICVTAQHRSMLDQVLEIFQIKPDYDLNLMRDNQNLTDITIDILDGIKKVLLDYQPDRIIVHGDTVTTLAASLAAYYQKIPVAHVEAGLRTGDIYAPWPEEINRRLTAGIADIHFAPTLYAKNNLINEGIKEDRIVVTGNTVIDALWHIHLLIENDFSRQLKLQQEFHYLNQEKKLILVTGHRRENFGDGLQAICEALAVIAKRKDVNIIFPVHLNPTVQQQVKSILEREKNIFLIAPLNYLQFVYLMKKSYLLLTDSGGVQEEAAALGKPALITRHCTERPEAIMHGNNRLVGTNKQQIVTEVEMLLREENSFAEICFSKNPYGDGKASERIVDVIKNMQGKVAKVQPWLC